MVNYGKMISLDDMRRRDKIDSILSGIGVIARVLIFLVVSISIYSLPLVIILYLSTLGVFNIVLLSVIGILFSIIYWVILTLAILAISA
jgi:hypothetical protein